MALMLTVLDNKKLMVQPEILVLLGKYSLTLDLLQVQQIMLKTLQSSIMCSDAQLECATLRCHKY